MGTYEEQFETCYNNLTIKIDFLIFENILVELYSREKTDEGLSFTYMKILM